MPDNTQPYRRMTDPLLIPVGPVASSVQIPDGFIKVGIQSFAVVNSNLCWVRLQGTSRSADGTLPIVPTLAQDGHGWLFPPGFFGVFGTQRPIWMSAIAVVRPGYPIANLTFWPLEISYGGGA